MENIFSKITLFSVCVFMASCAFDGEETKVLAEINEHYYIIEDVRYSNDGIQIGYSSGNDGGFESVSSNCEDIYYNRDTIMYSSAAFTGSKTISYYIIPITPKRADGQTNDPIQIKEAIFNANKVRFSKVVLPRFHTLTLHTKRKNSGISKAICSKA